MTSKDEILADFQACSGIEDVGEAFTRLEAVGWNLVQAINLSMDAEPSSGLGFEVIPQPGDLLTVDPDELSVPMPPAAAVPAATASAAAGDRGGGAEGWGDGAEAAGGGSGVAAADTDDVLHINIQVEVGGLSGSGAFPLEVPVSTTVGELKATLYQLLGINPCKQVLRGFSKESVTDLTVVTSVLLGPDKTLIVDTSSPNVASFHPYRRRADESGTPEVMELGDSDAVQVLPSVSDKKSSLDVSSHSLSNSLSQLPSTSSKYNSSSSSSSSKRNNSSNYSSSNHNSSKYGLSSSSRKLNSVSSPLSASGGTRSKYPNVVDISDSNNGGVVALDDDESPTGEDALYQLFIQDLTNKTDYTLPFPGHKTVGGVKQDVFAVTTIPVRWQRWTGWPLGCSDETTLSACGVSKAPCMTVSRGSSTASKPTPKTTRKGLSKTQSDSSSDEFEDAPELLQDDDDTFLEMMDSGHMDSKQMSLLPVSLEGSEQVCVDHFVKQFTARYSSTVPLFFQGPLAEAIDQSVMLPAAQRRLLAIYVHHDGSVLANVFCSQVLCQTATVSYLADNFVLWGWDVTHQVHKDRLVASISGHIGAAAGLTARSFRSEQLPALILLTRTRGTCEVLSIIYASTSSLDEVMTGLMEAVELFEGTRGAEVSEDLQRLNRQAIMNDQDAAYQESLRADRAKAELRRQQEMDEQLEHQRKEMLRLHEEQVTEQLRASLQSELPPEPEDTDSANVTVMRFRHPASDQFSRAFKLDTTLQVVLNFLHVRGFPADQFKFLQSWPRRDLSSLNVAKTLREYNIPNQETITIEER